jgi:hypothetical protein
MNDLPQFNYQGAVEGLAAMATTIAEMGGSEDDIVKQVGAYMLRIGLATPEDVDAIADAIARLPQPLNESADEIEKARPIREMLNVISAEDQLIASLRAREALRAFAGQLRSLQS